MFIVALTPLAGLALPALTPLVFAAAGALGYKAIMDMKDGGELNDALRAKLQETNRTRVQVDSFVLEAIEIEVKRAEVLHFVKGDIVMSLIKDERGKLRIEAAGPEGYDKPTLREEARLFAQELAQLFAQSRVVDELEKMNAVVTDEEVNDEGEIVLKVSRWT